MISLILLMFFFSYSGLEMTLDQTERQAHGSPMAFCFLDCEENVESTTLSPITIVSMTIFKKLPHASSDEDVSEKGSPVASLTLREPRLSRSSDNTKTEGLLEAKRSNIHIGMFKKVDCLAGYTCEVQTRDSNGNVRVNTNRLRQQPLFSGDLDTAGALTSSISVQLLTLTLQLDSKLALLGQSSDNLKDRVETMERRLENRMWLVDDKINTLDSRLEDKIELLGNNIESLKYEIENKIESRVVDKLCKLEAKVSNREVSKSDFEGEEPKTFTDNSVISEGVGDQIVSLGKVIFSLKKDIYQMQSLEKENQQGLKNLATEVTQVFETCGNLALIIKNDSAISQKQTNAGYNELGLDLKNSSAETMSYIRDLFYRLNETITSTVQSKMTEVLLPRSCRKGTSPVFLYPSFPYTVVYPSKESGLNVPHLCDAFTDGGGWIIIQRRSDGNVDFYRDWDTYKEGFGSIAGDFWLGNENIHSLTSNGVYELRVEVIYKGRLAFANYDRFSLDREESKYTIRLGQYSGTAGDSLNIHDGEPFSTYDKDHDLYNRNCAEVFTGAWWYKACHHSNLNGKWHVRNYKGPNWQTMTKGDPVTYSEMKIRRVDQP